MTTRFLVKTNKGYLTAEWVNGRIYPECFGFSEEPSMTFTQSRAEMLEELADNNGLDPKIISLIY